MSKASETVNGLSTQDQRLMGRCEPSFVLGYSMLLTTNFLFETFH